MTTWPTHFPGVRFETASPKPSPMGSLDDTALQRALDDAGCDAFLTAARSSSIPLTVVVNDTHRLTDTRSFLDALFARLDGAAPARLRLLVATGSHRSTADERRQHERRILGRWADRFEQVAWHDARDEATHRPVGRHRLHVWMSEGGHYLACGSMEPHYFAGVTGAHKTLTVGVMSLESLTSNHAHAMSAEATGLRLAGNPVYEGIARAIRDLEATGARLFCANQVVANHAVVAWTAGHPLAALEAGMPLVRQCFAHAVTTPVDLVIARVAPPLDRDVYQADKGIKNTEVAVRDRGVLLVEAACKHGVGIDHFVDLLRAAPTYSDALRIVGERGYRLGDHKAVRLRALTDTRGVHVGLVSTGVDPGLATTLGMTILPGRAAAAAWACRHLPTGSAKGLVVEDAGNMTLVRS